jgi:hypothetical protein
MPVAVFHCGSRMACSANLGFRRGRLLLGSGCAQQVGSCSWSAHELVLQLAWLSLEATVSRSGVICLALPVLLRAKMSDAHVRLVRLRHRLSPGGLFCLLCCS